MEYSVNNVPVIIKLIVGFFVWFWMDLLVYLIKTTT